ncbi:MAG: hypothetical protein QJR06_10410 [Alicyclobacillaceae bacterium]|nr:hypothetical protein [Alicyclobacillaceae bacterium]
MRFRPRPKKNRLTFETGWRQNILPEEFPEGPYGMADDPQPSGKSTPWEQGQRVVSRFRDENPAFSDRKSPDGNELPDLT